MAGLGSVLKPLKALQDHLGQVNDLAVQDTAMQSFGPDTGAMTDAARLQVTQTLAALTTRLHQRKLAERGKTLGILSDFLRSDMQKTMRKIFHPRHQGS